MSKLTKQLEYQQCTNKAVDGLLNDIARENKGD